MLVYPLIWSSQSGVFTTSSMTWLPFSLITFWCLQEYSPVKPLLHSTMPRGPFGEVLGTTGTLDMLGSSAQQYKSKVSVPRNPKLVKDDTEEYQVQCPIVFFNLKTLKFVRIKQLQKFVRIKTSTEILALWRNISISYYKRCFGFVVSEHNFSSHHGCNFLLNKIL